MVDQALADQFGEELGFGGYGGVFNVGDHELVMTCDGVGTKLHIANYLNKLDTIGIDLVAMCANDLICMGATPIGFMDYYACDKLELERSHEIIKGVLEGCRQAGCELMGGETAQLSNLFRTDDQFDLAGFMVGEKRGVFDESPIQAGDVLVGLHSSGMHSNGFTTIRDFYMPIEWREWMLAPTEIYVNSILHNMHDIKSCAHITGGGLAGNIPRAIPASSNLTFKLDIEIDPFWEVLGKSCNIGRGEMMTIFNCGYGMVLVMEPSKLEYCEFYECHDVIGEIVEG